MIRVVHFIEQGLLALAGDLSAASDGAGGLLRVASAIPPLRGLGRLWGGTEPSRAAGFASAVSHPYLRAFLRAAIMESADWPMTMAASVLRRAEQDVLAAECRAELTAAELSDLTDALGLAWARRAPATLHAFDNRFRQPVLQTVASPLWRQAMLDLATHWTITPEPRELPPGSLESWLRQSLTGLTGASRARACLAIAAAWYQYDPPTTPDPPPAPAPAP